VAGGRREKLLGQKKKAGREYPLSLSTFRWPPRWRLGGWVGVGGAP
jgi:hypothetical protein